MSASAGVMIALRHRDGLASMRRAGQVVADILKMLRDRVRPGVTPIELDRWADEMTQRMGALPAFRGYRGYPATLCASVNEAVVHAIPTERPLQEGDIVGLDMGAIVAGFYADAALTAPVGRISREAETLVRITREALERAVPLVRPGQRVGDLSSTVQSYVERNGYSVVRDFVGHGIGRSLHEEPQVPNYGKPHTGPKLKAGMTLCVEPMVNAGGARVEVLPDGWTVVTADRKWSAHFEHTIHVTESGPEILTPWDR